jgi:hypothetical protein
MKSILNMLLFIFFGFIGTAFGLGSEGGVLPTMIHLEQDIYESVREHALGKDIVISTLEDSDVFKFDSESDHSILLKTLSEKRSIVIESTDNLDEASHGNISFDHENLIIDLIK